MITVETLGDKRKLSKDPAELLSLFAFGEDLRRRWVKITSGPLLLVWVLLLIFEAPVDREANLFLLSLTGLTNLYATGVIGSKGGS